MPEQGSIASAHWKVQAWGLHVKLSFHVKLTHKIICFSSSGLLLLILRSETSYSPLHVEQHQEGETRTQMHAQVRVLGSALPNISASR